MQSNLRGDFSILNVNQFTYIDSAATSLTPDLVLEAMDTYYRKCRASVHRGLYESAVRATEAYEQARGTLATFLGAEADEIVFTGGATASANMLTYALEQSLDWSEGDEVLTTVMEHHASLIPLQQLAKRKGLVLKHIPLTGFELDCDVAANLITKKTNLVSVMLASNVLGTINDVARIAQRAHEVGARVVVDATAAVGHLPVNVRTLDCDFLYFSGHKMCGPTGIGVLYGKSSLLETLEPGFFGGGMVEEVTLETARWSGSPLRFEAGTPNIAGAIGLGRAAAYLTDLGLDKVGAHCQALIAYAHDALVSVPGITLYSAPPERNCGIVSFTLDHIHPHDIAQVCAQDTVAIRGGHHCAMPLHSALGIQATARASVYVYNSSEDIDALVASLRHALDVFT